MEPSVAAPSERIRWPARFDPRVAPIHVRNEIDIAAPAEGVWQLLIAAADWPTWYSNASDVAIEGAQRTLSAGARFRWRTFGVALVSEVAEFEPPHRLAWTGRGAGVDVYHAWLLTDTAEGTHVLTEESQYGALARVDRALRPHRMETFHQVWLESLRSQVVGPGREAAGRSG